MKNIIMQTGEAMPEQVAVEALAALLKVKPRSFRALRERTSLHLSDGQFRGLMAAHPDLFVPARFLRHDEEGKRLHPGRPGVKLKPIAAP